MGEGAKNEGVLLIEFKIGYEGEHTKRGGFSFYVVQPYTKELC